MASGEIIITEDGETTLFKYSCKYNDGVGCGPINRHCEKCGWNPVVASERLLRICFEMGIDIPESVLVSM